MRYVALTYNLGSPLQIENYWADKKLQRKTAFDGMEQYGKNGGLIMRRIQKSKSNKEVISM